MSRLKQFLLKNLLHQQRKANKTGGFTLIELLVAMILTVLIITPLMTLVLSMMDTDRKEEAKATTETEIQAALNYIADDLQQAVYIYDATALKNTSNTSATNAADSGIKDQIPPVKPVNDCSVTTECIPVLVFWKRKYLDRKDDVKDTVTNSYVNIGTDITDSIEGSDRYVYSLVAYYLIKDNSTTWQGKARIARFEIRDGISKTDSSGNVTVLLNPSQGFKRFNTVTSDGSLSLRMNRWVSGTYDAAQSAVTTLIDYVDDTALTDITDTNILAQFTPPANDRAVGNAEYSSVCSTERTGLSSSTISPDNQQSSRVPPDSIDTLKTGSFYACVNPINAQGQSVAQVYIRGTALRRLPEYSQVTTALANQYNINYFPIASVRVAVIGVLGEN